MLDKTQVTKIAVAGFGAAMASVYAIPEAHATILPISFNPGTVPAAQTATMFITSHFQPGFGFDPAAVTAGSALGALKVYNNTRTSVYHAVIAANRAKGIRATGNIQFIAESPNHTLSPASFGGGGDGIFTPYTRTNPNIDYYGFKHGGNVGWFGVIWGGDKGSIRFIGGGYGNAGESIIVGSMDPVPGGGSSGSGGDVPEPSELGLFSLGLLALGAAGVRMRREARKVAELN